MENLLIIGASTLYLVALINPVSKVAILGGMKGSDDGASFSSLVNKATIVASIILIVSMMAGAFILQTVFHVKMWSVQLAGGIVVAWVGFNALRHGIFFEESSPHKTQDFAMVPIACPMIAGPASITACMALFAQHGALISVSSLLCAVTINHIIMLSAHTIHKALSSHGLLGATIRITGLIVMTIGIDMILISLSAWMKSGITL